MGKFSVSELPTDSEKQFKAVLKVFVSKLLSKWKDCKQIYDRFMKKHAQWLEGDLNLPQMYYTSISVPVTSANTTRGRPKKVFPESSDRTKQRDINPIVLEISTEKLSHATESK